MRQRFEISLRKEIQVSKQQAFVEFTPEALAQRLGLPFDADILDIKMSFEYDRVLIKFSSKMCPVVPPGGALEKVYVRNDGRIVE